jgi:hypothetical protein
MFPFWFGQSSLYISPAGMIFFPDTAYDNVYDVVYDIVYDVACDVVCDFTLVHI